MSGRGASFVRRAIRAIRAIGAVGANGACLAALSACPSGVNQSDSLGEQGIVAFTAETPLAFSNRLVVGSTFTLAYHAADAKDDGTVAKGTLSSSNAKVVTLAPNKVTVVGPGTANLELKDAKGKLIDSIAVHAGVPGATTLVDGDLLAASSSIDARLPVKFAWTTDDAHVLQVSAVDKCGGDMIDLHASSVVDAGGQGTVPMAVSEVAPATFSVKTQQPGTVGLVLKTPGLADLVYDARSVDAGAVDQVKIAPVAVDDQNNVTLWGQTFENDIQTIGAPNVTWVADPRVTLAVPTGVVVSANVSVQGPNDPPDTRPATVTATAFGVQSQPLDLLSLGGQAAVTSYGAPARVVPSDGQGPGYPAGGSTGGCGGSGGCNPEAAVLGLVGIRSLRKLRGLRRMLRLDA